MNYVELSSDGLPQIRDMWLRLNFYHLTLPANFLYRFTSPDFDAHCDYLRSLERLKIFIVQEEGRATGFCIAVGNGSKGEIDSIYVEPTFRSMRIGAELIKLAVSWLRETSTEITVLVAHGNERATSFYVRQGFKLRYSCYQLDDAKHMSD